MSRHLLIQKQFIWRFDTFLIDKGTIGIYIVYDKTWMYTGINVDQAVKALSEHSQNGKNHIFKVRKIARNL